MQREVTDFITSDGFSIVTMSLAPLIKPFYSSREPEMDSVLPKRKILIKPHIKND